MVPRLFGLTATMISLAGVAPAAEFVTETWRGKEVLRLTGPIVEGTTKKFSAAIADAAPAGHGLPILLLDSPGGDVEEALAMSRMMDRHPFHTVVPDGASSACASILFIAGSYRTVEPLGLIGQHSCSTGGKPNQACNDALAEHAVAHGVPYGGVAAFVTYTPPEEILLLGREEADGWGLTRYPGERESGYQRSDPLAVQFFVGAKPPAQTAWRLDFRGDGFRAFLRPVADDERELQLNLFCEEALRSRLFVSMEIYGPAQVISEATLAVRVTTDRFWWEDATPVVWQMDSGVAEVITEIPRERIIPFLVQADRLKFLVEMGEPNQPDLRRYTAKHQSRGASLCGQQLRVGKLGGSPAALKPPRTRHIAGGKWGCARTSHGRNGHYGPRSIQSHTLRTPDVRMGPRGDRSAAVVTAPRPTHPLIPTALSFDSAKGFPNRLKSDSLRVRQRRQGWQERSRSRGGR